MTDAPARPEPPDFERVRAEAAAQLASRLEGARVAAQRAGTVIVPVGAARLVLTIGRADAPRAFARFATTSLAYAIDGELGASVDAAKRVLLAAASLAAEFAGDQAAPPEPSLGAGGARETLEALVPAVVARHRLAIASWHRGPPPRTVAVAPCLALELRPPFPTPSVQGPRPTPGPLAAPCDGCGVALACPRPRAHAEGPVAALRPLRHAERVGAVRAGLEAVASAFEQRVPHSIESLVLETIAMRRGLASGPETPFELSLKIEAGKLVPALRVVEYAPPASGGRDPREARRARSLALAAIASRRLDARQREALAEWLELLARHAPAGVEMSIGIDAPFDESLAPALQLYAHVEPTDRAAMRGIAEAALAWSRVGPLHVGAIDALLETPDAEGGRPELTLLAFSPSARDPRRSKLYFALPVAMEHGPSRLAAPARDPLFAFAPRVGLAVLETNAGEPSWRKRDFPNTAHFQDGGASFAAFCAGLADDERARAERIVDGERFAAWPTWLSVGATGERATGPVRTFYFVPR